MAKLTLLDITSGFDVSAYNANNALIEAALENTLSRDGTIPNTMSADIDLNSNDLNNIINTRTQNLYLNGVKVTGVYPEDLTELTGLADTNLGTLADNEFLRYDLATEKWINDVLVAADITSAFVTQHEANLTILESQITNAGVLARNADAETIAGLWTFTNLQTFEGGIDVGSDGGGDSVVQFYDDNSDTYRSIFWDDDLDAFFFEDNAGGFNELGTGGGTGFLLIGA